MIRNSTTVPRSRSKVLSSANCEDSDMQSYHIISYDTHLLHSFVILSYVQQHIMPFQFVFPCLSTLATYISAKTSKMWREPNVDSRLFEERFHGECGALHELSKCKSPQTVIPCCQLRMSQHGKSYGTVAAGSLQLEILTIEW